MLTRTHITLLLGLAILIWATALLLAGNVLTWQMLGPFTLTVSILTLLCIGFEKLLWRWNVLRGWLVDTAYIGGSWKARLVSDWVNPETGHRVPPINCLVVIRQTYSSLSFRLHTRESSSYFVAGKLTRQNDGVFHLFGVYQNTPGVQLRGVRSEIHYGALFLEASEEPITAMSGHYWNDRGTRGSIELSDRTAEILTYQSATERYGLPPK